MSNEELAIQIQAGRNDLLHELWKQVERYIEKRARYYYTILHGRRGIEVDELINHGYFALVDAVETYDVKISRFITWLDYYLRIEYLKNVYCMGMYNGTWSCRPDVLETAISLDAPLGDDLDDCTLADAIADPEADMADDILEMYYTEQLHAALEEALDSLPEMYSSVLRRHYFDNESQVEIGQSIGISKEAISSREKYALERIRNKPWIMRKLYSFYDTSSGYAPSGLYAYKSTWLSQQECLIIKREKSLETARKISQKMLDWKK